MILEIKTFPDEILRRKAKPVEVFDEKLHKLLDDMAETMYEAPGYGIAAPQVGESLRMVVIDDTAGKVKGRLIEVINPEILEKSGEIMEEEGCLSIPGEYAYVKRFAKVKVRCQDRHGNEKIIDGENKLARILQHEMDHLEGTLFIDKLPSIKRETIKKHLKKRIQAGDYVVTGGKK